MSDADRAPANVSAFAGFDRKVDTEMWLVRHRASKTIILTFAIRAFDARANAQTYFHAAYSELDVEKVDGDYEVEVDSIVVVKASGEVGVTECRARCAFTWPGAFDAERDLEPTGDCYRVPVEPEPDFTAIEGAI